MSLQQTLQFDLYWLKIEIEFPIVNFPWLSGDVPRLPSYGIYISKLVRFARCCTSVFDFHSKNLQITSKLLTQGYRYHKLFWTFGKFFRSYSELLSKFGAMSFQEYVFKGITHPVFYGDLVYKLRRVKGEKNFISSGSKIVKRLDVVSMTQGRSSVIEYSRNPKPDLAPVNFFHIPDFLKTFETCQTFGLTEWYIVSDRTKFCLTSSTTATSWICQDCQEATILTCLTHRSDIKST